MAQQHEVRWPSGSCADRQVSTSAASPRAGRKRSLEAGGVVTGRVAHMVIGAVLVMLLLVRGGRRRWQGCHRTHRTK